MSDSLRQDATDKAASSLKPDSEKSTLEYAQDQVKAAGDSIASTIQPEGDKSAGQKATDAVSGSGSTGNSYLEQAQEAIGNAVEQAKDALGYGSNTGTGSSST